MTIESGNAFREIGPKSADGHMWTSNAYAYRDDSDSLNIQYTLMFSISTNILLSILPRNTEKFLFTVTQYRYTDCSSTISSAISNFKETSPEGMKQSLYVEQSLPWERIVGLSTFEV